MDNSNNITLISIVKRFNNWSDIFLSDTFSSAFPKIVIRKLNEYNGIITFKMMASLSLELYFKTYILVLVHKKDPNKYFTSDDDFYDYLKSYSINKRKKSKKNWFKTHDLKELIEWIIKEDNSFDVDYIEKAINYFNCFEEIRYPTKSKQPNQVNGLFDYNCDMEKTFTATYELLRKNIKSYILKINQIESDELECEFKIEQE